MTQSRDLLADALVALAAGIVGTRYVREQASAAAGEPHSESSSRKASSRKLRKRGMEREKLTDQLPPSSARSNTN
jgi:hypothetical protein